MHQRKKRVEKLDWFIEGRTVYSRMVTQTKLDLWMQRVKKNMEEVVEKR